MDEANWSFTYSRILLIRLRKKILSLVTQDKSRGHYAKENKSNTERKKYVESERVSFIEMKERMVLVNVCDKGEAGRQVGHSK